MEGYGLTPLYPLGPPTAHKRKLYTVGPNCETWHNAAPENPYVSNPVRVSFKRPSRRGPQALTCRALRDALWQRFPQHPDGHAEARTAAGGGAILNGPLVYFVCTN